MCRNPELSWSRHDSSFFTFFFSFTGFLSRPELLASERSRLRKGGSAGNHPPLFSSCFLPFLVFFLFFFFTLRTLHAREHSESTSRRPTPPQPQPQPSRHPSREIATRLGRVFIRCTCGDADSSASSFFRFTWFSAFRKFRISPRVVVTLGNGVRTFATSFRVWIYVCVCARARAYIHIYAIGDTVVFRKKIDLL